MTDYRAQCVERIRLIHVNIEDRGVFSAFGGGKVDTTPLPLKF